MYISSIHVLVSTPDSFPFRKFLLKTITSTKTNTYKILNFELTPVISEKCKCRNGQIHFKIWKYRNFKLSVWSIYYLAPYIWDFSFHRIFRKKRKAIKITWKNMKSWISICNQLFLNSIVFVVRRKAFDTVLYNT